MTITPPEFGGCPWPLAPGCITDAWAAHDEPVKELALAYASATLERLTAYRVGVCPITVRPCSQEAAWARSGMFPGVGMHPVNWGGTWSNVVCGWSSGCGGGCEVTLPAPIGRVDEVKVNGTVLAPSDYAVVGTNILAWRGTGPCPFPRGQDMSLPDTEPNTFSVTYLNAYPVDLLGANAVTILAEEFAKACEEDESCALPPNVTTLVRQGVTMQIASGAFPGGETGIKQVDTYIALWNPQHRTHPGVVMSPDLPQFRMGH